jgi:hypothetical protein
MPGYIKKKLQEYGHIMPRKIQGCPYAPEPKQFGTEAQASFPQDKMPNLDEKGFTRVQKFVGSILYSMLAVDMTILMALSTIAVNQTKATKRTMGPQRGCKSTFPCVGHDIKHSFRRIVPARGKSKEQGVWTFFMGWMPKNGEPIQINGALHVSTTIMQFLVASAAEAELGTLYHNCQTGIIF